VSLDGDAAIGTIVARNYLPFARVLAASLFSHHPDLPCFVVIADDPDDVEAPDRDRLNVIRLADLGFEPPRESWGRWSCQEFAVLLKPYLLRHLFARGFTTALYLDPDMLIVGDLSPALHEVGKHPCTLVPHVLSPIEGPERIARELTLLRAGTFNAGVIGVSSSPAADAMLEWWSARLLADCSDSVERGVYYDQRWLDLLPVLFDGVHILRDPGVNIAYWNLEERDVTIDGTTVRAQGGPARLFHFSGFDPMRPLQVSRHAPAMHVESTGAAQPIYARYAELLLDAGYEQSRSLAWGLGGSGSVAR
jgi:hypothetical protein